MLQVKILILKLRAIDGLSSSTIASCEVTALDHKLFDHTVESRAFVGEWLSCLANALLARAESAKVLSRLRYDIVVELEGDAASFFASNRDIEKDPAAVFFVGHLESEILRREIVGRLELGELSVKC